MLLRRYRTEVVHPVFQLMEEQHFLSSAQGHMSIQPWTVAEVFTLPPADPLDMLAMDEGPLTWCYYRIWSVVRITGLWPLACIGRPELPATLASCPLCAAQHVDVRHALVECPGTLSWRSQGNRGNDTLLMSLQSQEPAAIRFVGGCLHFVMIQALESSESESL